MPQFVTNNTLYRLLVTLTAKVDNMSQTIPQQVDALTAAMQADAADISAKLDMIIANMPVGSNVTQAQVDALAAVKTALDAAAAKADAAAAPPVPPAPAP